jgi:hypothetical protein
MIQRLLFWKLTMNEFITHAALVIALTAVRHCCLGHCPELKISAVPIQVLPGAHVKPITIAGGGRGHHTLPNG